MTEQRSQCRRASVVQRRQRPCGRREFARTLTDGTPTVVDFRTARRPSALHGYYFEKTAQNLTSLESPATTAAPGDTCTTAARLHVDQTINTITITTRWTHRLRSRYPSQCHYSAPRVQRGWTFNSARPAADLWHACS